MRKTVHLLIAVVIVAALQGVMALDMKWSYHDDNDDIDDRGIETIPGEFFTFVKNGGAVVADEDDISLYVITAHDFAQESEEQVFVRWWNGQEEHWIMGAWEDNIRLGDADDAAGKFHNLPRVGAEMVDLWRIDISNEITKPGENFYTIQLKGWSETYVEEAYLLRTETEESQANELGQEWTEGSYFGGDWSISITE